MTIELIEVTIPVVPAIEWEDCGLGVVNRKGASYYETFGPGDSVQLYMPLYGVVNQKGKIIVPFGKYDEIDHYSDGYFEVQRDGLNGLINEAGEELLMLEKGMGFPYGGHCVRDNRTVSLFHA